MEDAPQEIGRELVRLWRVWKTTKQMLWDRGYEMLQEELDITLDEFRAKYADSNGQPDRSSMAFSLKPSLEMLKKYTNPPTPKDKDPRPRIGTVRVEFNGDTAIGVKTVRGFVHQIQENNYYTGILVTAVPVSSACHKLGQALAPQIMEIFQESDLLVNITQHELVPKHVLLSVEEKDALLHRYRLKANQLPRIMLEDAVARYLGLRRGEVVKIIRRSTTAGRYASYRICI